MKPRHAERGSTREEAVRSIRPSQEPMASPRPRHRGWRRFFIVVLILVVVGGVGRAIMPWGVRKYVNRTLDRNQLYEGTIGTVTIHLWRGAYAIHDIKISKRTGNVPVPLFAAKQIDFAVQWNALFHGRIVGRVLMNQPELNFVDAPSEGESQTGEGRP